MDTRQVRERLLRKRDELRAREAQANAGLRQQPDVSTMDFADDAKQREGNSELSALSRTADLELRQVEDALQRLGEGRYCTCSVCGEEIEPARLEALPYADKCIRCAERSESGGLRPS